MGEQGLDPATNGLPRTRFAAMPIDTCLTLCSNGFDLTDLAGTDVAFPADFQSLPVNRR
jgi:hypothetical protein